jgi:hypothetical protein
MRAKSSLLGLVVASTMFLVTVGAMLRLDGDRHANFREYPLGM